MRRTWNEGRGAIQNTPMLGVGDGPSDCAESKRSCLRAKVRGVDEGE
jgi:hypothetical protein